MKRIIFCIAILIAFLLSVSSCNKVGKPSPEKDKKTSDSKTSENAGDSSTTKQNDLPATVLEDVKAKFISNGMTLSSMQRFMDGDENIIKAMIKESDEKIVIPKAMKIIADNFSSIDKVEVAAGENGKKYTIESTKLTEILRKSKEEGGDFDTLLWAELGKSETPKMESSSANQPEKK